MLKIDKPIEYYYALFGKCEVKEILPDNFIRATCKFCRFGGASYVTAFAIFGIVINSMDLYNLVMRGQVLTQDYWRNRVDRGSYQIFNEGVEKMIKIAFLVLTWDHFLLLLLSVFLNAPNFAVPWLFIETLVIFLELFLFIIRVGVQRHLPGRKEWVLMAVTIFNWAQTLCYQQDLVWTLAAANRVTPCPGCRR